MTKGFDAEAFIRGPVSANILGDCPICGSAMTIATATLTRYDNTEVERFDMLTCSKDIAHFSRLAPSDSRVYPDNTTADQTLEPN